MYCIAILPEDLDDSEDVSHSTANDSMSSTISNDSAYRMKVPVEEDFDYIKQISNGAYG